MLLTAPGHKMDVRSTGLGGPLLSNGNKETESDGNTNRADDGKLLADTEDKCAIGKLIQI